MIFRVTRKLARKIKVIPIVALSPHDDPFLDWTANLFMVSRWQCIILTNSQSLYSVIIRGKGVTNEAAFVEQGLKSLGENLARDGFFGLFETRIAPAAHSIRFCKAGDRRVLGSMKELVFLAKCDLIEMGYPLTLVNHRLNRIPMSKLKYRYSVEEFAALANQSRV